MKTLLPDVEVLERRDDIKFQCKCSRERVEQTLISLGRSELEQLLAEDGQAEVSCHFCNETYRFNGSELSELIESI